MVGTGEHALDDPAGKLAAVVLHLCGNDGSALGVELLSPLHGATGTLSTRIKLVQGLEGNVGLLTLSRLDDSIDLSTDDKRDILILVGREVELAITVSNKRDRLLIGTVEGVAVLQIDNLLRVDNLGSKVGVDVGGLQGQSSGRVDAVLVAAVHGWVGRVLVDRDIVELAALPSVENNLVACPGDDNVPGVDGAGSSHQDTDNTVGGENTLLALTRSLSSQVGENRIIRGGNIVALTVNLLEDLFLLGVDTVVSLVVSGNSTILSTIKLKK